MTPTETLRAMLDERGVEWETDRSGFRVMWGKPVDEFHDTMQFKAVDNALPNGGLNVHICGFTPEQAIAATLGSSNCSNSERTSDELLSCPFCGAKAEVWQDYKRTWGLIEHEPDCWLAYDVPRHKQEIPRAEFAAWNRRADE